MNLGDLITRLEAANPDQTVRHGFHNPHSYRGDYYDLTFEPATNITVADMLEAARSALGATYEGWKGGDFKMTADTWCWLSREGSASGETISALLLDLMLAPDRPTALRQAVEALPADRGQMAAAAEFLRSATFRGAMTATPAVAALLRAREPLADWLGCLAVLQPSERGSDECGWCRGNHALAVARAVSQDA